MIARVAFPIPKEQLFDYEVPEGLRERVGPGSRVRAPFGRRSAWGVVVESPDSSPAASLKEISEIQEPSPLIPEEVLNLARFTAGHYACSLGEALAVCGPPGPVPKRQVPFKVLEDESSDQSRPSRLTDGQNRVLEVLLPAVQAGSAAPFLLRGVTGSGKTEVYLRAAEATLEKGRSVLYLLPEIALADRLGKALARRFPGVLALLHSGLPRGERHGAYNRVLRGEARLILGTRSAVFAPARNLGLLIVDEEHEQAYKQEESPRYNARDLAVLRAKEAGALLILGSATPSLESEANAERGRYKALDLPDRVDSRPLPRVRLLDMRQHLGRDSFLSYPLRQALKERLDRGEQSLLLLNRRGFASVMVCGDCGEAVRCSRCEVSLVLHRNPENLRCHYCGLARAKPAACDACGGRALSPQGAGTQRVETELREVFPGLRLARVDTDTASRRHAVEKALRDFARGALDLLLGTQMIAKGLDFPGVTLVGVVNADTALHFPDFRAEERTHQLLTQAAGRAGRGEKPGEVLIQTLNPQHPALAAVEGGAADLFLRGLLKTRRLLGYPPYKRLCRVVCESAEEAEASSSAEAFSEAAALGSDAPEVLGPAPAPLARIRNRWRWHLLIRGPAYGPIHAALARGRAAMPPSRTLAVRVDVDPQNLL